MKRQVNIKYIQLFNLAEFDAELINETDLIFFFFSVHPLSYDTEQQNI